MWRSHLARSLHQHRNQPEARFFQLATVGLDQRPRNRTVVFRGFLEHGDRLSTPLRDCIKIVTDRRSQKAAEIAANPWAEVSWYFPKTRSQYRIAGKLILVDQDLAIAELQNLRTLAWQALSEPARTQFAWQHPRALRDPNFGQVQPPDPQQAIADFCLLLLEPTEIDRLELRGNPQNRWLYNRDDQGDWIETEVNP